MATKKTSRKHEGNPDWKKGGESPNPGGRKPGRSSPVSHLRRTLARLREMEKDALDNIQKSVKGEDVKTESLKTSQWVITNIMAVNRAAVAEEQHRWNVNVYHDEKEERQAEQKEGTSGNVIKGRFSTKMVEADDSDEE